MSRLVIQHPTLPESAVLAFSERLGTATRRGATPEIGWAAWHAAAIGRREASDLAMRHGVDCSLLADPCSLADFRLIACDMDSTLITIECIDELADFAGVKPQVAAITEATMRGEITNFEESLRRRVALLAGLPASVLPQVFEQRLRLSPGAHQLIEGTRKAGLKSLLVSGGFTFFADRVRSELRMDWSESNVLEIEDGRLTGRVTGEIVGAERKRERLLQACAELGIAASAAIVVGDGSNDLRMMEDAGISVAYHAKPRVREQASQAIDHCGLDAILNFFH